MEFKENIPADQQKKEKDPASNYYCKVTAITSVGLVTDYLMGDNEQDVRKAMAKRYSLEKEEIESIHAEPISKEEFVKKMKQINAIRNEREEKDR